MFLLLTQHLACGHSRQRSYGHAVMRSCSHGQERFLSAQLRVAAMNRLEKLAALPLGQIRCGLPKRQSRVRRRPTAARVGYSPSRDPSAAWPKSIRRPPYCFFFSRVRLLRHTDLLDRLGNGLTSPHLDFDTRSLGMICSASSFFPRGIECPPLVVTLTESRSGSGAV